MSKFNAKSLFRGIDPSFLLGTLVTVLFYAVVLQPGMRDTALRLYTTEHVVEYVIVALFFWGVCDVVLKVLALPREFLALRQEWLPAAHGRQPVTQANRFLEQIDQMPTWASQSRMGRRLKQALTYVKEKGAGSDFGDYLNYLAEQNDDHTHANYMLVRFVAGVTPLLGFLGTVVHFGTALSGIAVDQLMNQLSLVVSEMGAAFNTTTVALGAAMTMTIFLFICERIERSIDRSIDRYAEHELLHRFIGKDSNIQPMLASVQSASEEAIKEIGSTLDRQVAIWSKALADLYAGFDAQRRQDQQAWTQALAVLLQRSEALDADRENRMRQILTLIENRQDGHFKQLQTSLDRALSLRNDFVELTRTLQEIAQGEGQLLHLQNSVAENLRVLRETQQLDEAMHGLTAAIHLLTARQAPAASLPRRAA